MPPTPPRSSTSSSSRHPHREGRATTSRAHPRRPRSRPSWLAPATAPGRSAAVPRPAMNAYGRPGGPVAPAHATAPRTTAAPTMGVQTAGPARATARPTAMAMAAPIGRTAPAPEGPPTHSVPAAIRVGVPRPADRGRRRRAGPRPAEPTAPAGSTQDPAARTRRTSRHERNQLAVPGGRKRPDEPS